MNEKLFMENLAKNILIKANLLNNYDMQKSESPDFIDKTATIGLEITISNNSIPYTMMTIRGQDINNVTKKHNYIKKINGKIIKKNQQKINNKLIIYEDNDNYYTSFDIYLGFDLINKEIEKKIKKLQNYKKCKEYRLFIFAPSLFLNSTESIKKSELKKEIKYIKNIMNESNIKFNIIYFFTINEIYILNVDLESFDSKNITVDEKMYKETLLESNK